MNPLRGCVIRLSLKASVPGLFLGLTAAVTPAANAGGDSAGEVGAAGAAPGGSRRPRHSAGLPRSPRITPITKAPGALVLAPTQIPIRWGW